MSKLKCFIFALCLVTCGLEPRVYAQDAGVVLPPVPRLQLPDPSLLPVISPREPRVGAVIFPMHFNARAPFTGVLFSNEAVAQFIVQQHTEVEQERINTERAVADRRAQDQVEIDTLNNNMQALRSQLQLQVTNRDTQITDLNTRLTRAVRGDPVGNFFRTAAWVVGGVALGAITVTAIVLLNGNHL